MKQKVYRALLSLTPSSIKSLQGTDRLGLGKRVLSIVRRYRCRGGVVRLFQGSELLMNSYFGDAGQAGPMQQDTFVRCASISKMLTAACVLKLSEERRLSLDADVNQWLPFAIRHPLAPTQPITLRMLMSHTAGIQDGKTYQQGVGSGVPASSILAGDSYCNHRPGEAWSYSNFGAGLVGSVLEGILWQSFEEIMQQHLFRPLKVQASFYPDCIQGPLSDAWHILPPGRRPAFDAQARKIRRIPLADEAAPEQHYGLAQGNCCIQAQGLQTVLDALMNPGFLKESTLADMRMPLGSFGHRSPYLQQGIGIFQLQDKRISHHVLYGHQGNAYGAVHATFFEPISGRGLVFLSSGASAERQDFLSMLVSDLLLTAFGGNRG